MNARLSATALGLIIGLSSALWALGCSSGDESLGSDQNAAANDGGGTSSQPQPDPKCDVIECFRPVECVETCGGPIVSSSCCPCAPGLLDELVDCPPGAEGGGNSGGASGSTGSGGGPGSGGYSGAPAEPQGGEGGFSQGGVGGDGGGEVDLDQLGIDCVDDACPAGLTPVHYYGISGSEPLFCSCEIPCEEGPEVCPPPTICVTISDGPGAVCRQN